MRMHKVSTAELRGKVIENYSLAFEASTVILEFTDGTWLYLRANFSQDGLPMINTTQYGKD